MRYINITSLLEQSNPPESCKQAFSGESRSCAAKISAWQLFCAIILLLTKDEVIRKSEHIIYSTLYQMPLCAWIGDACCILPAVH